jgi:hypothetical protein
MATSPSVTAGGTAGGVVLGESVVLILLVVLGWDDTFCF